jgi:hypothetical protein
MLFLESTPAAVATVADTLVALLARGTTSVSKWQLNGAQAVLRRDKVETVIVEGIRVHLCLSMSLSCHLHGGDAPRF